MQAIAVLSVKVTHVLFKQQSTEQSLRSRFPKFLLKELIGTIQKYALYFPKIYSALQRNVGGLT